MNNLTKLWDANDESLVAEELKKLFIFQGIQKSQESINTMASYFSTELSSRGYPVKAVISGINKLKDEDLRTVKLSDLIRVCKDFIEKQSQEKINCDYCFSSGLVMMRNEDRYQFSLGCTCENGDAWVKKGNARWNGEKFQHSKANGLLEKIY